MSGEQILPLRLPPSGALILDALSQQALMAGEGTPGLVWRGQYSGNPAVGTDIGAQYATPVAIPGLGGAWLLRGGYVYDVQFELSIASGVGATVNNLVVVVEGSHDGGVTWTEGMLGLTWPATSLLAAEAGTFPNGALRFRLAVGPDITAVRLRAGASGNAGDRVVYGGYLRIEQFAEGDEPEEIRQNPSGTFVLDKDSDVPLIIGSGSPGLVYRAQATAQQAIAGTIPSLIPGLAQAWSIPAGYRYEINMFGSVFDSAGGVGGVAFLVEASTDSGATWSTILANTVAGANLLINESREFFAGRMEWTPTVNVTNVRCSAAGGVANRTLANGFLKIEQYVA